MMIFVPDLREAKRFYSEVLGFPVRSEEADRVVFAHPGCDLVAFRCDRGAEVGEYSREARAVLVFAVASIDETVARLRAEGIRVLHDTPASNSLGRYAAFVDPFGIVHEVLEVHPTGPAGPA